MGETELVREGREGRERRAEKKSRKDLGDSVLVVESDLDSRRPVWRAMLAFVGTG